MKGDSDGSVDIGSIVFDFADYFWGSKVLTILDRLCFIFTYCRIFVFFFSSFFNKRSFFFSLKKTIGFSNPNALKVRNFGGEMKWNQNVNGGNRE